jgi:translation initiation factor IF-1
MTNINDEKSVVSNSAVKPELSNPEIDNPNDALSMSSNWTSIGVLLFIILVFLLGTFYVFNSQIIGNISKKKGEPPLDITWRESRLDKAGGIIPLIKGQPAEQSYVLQIKNSGTQKIGDINVTVKATNGEIEGWDLLEKGKYLNPDESIELGKIKTSGRGFLHGDTITVTASDYEQSKTLSIQVQKTGLDEEPPLEITWRNARADIFSKTYVLQISKLKNAQQGVGQISITVKSSKGETELFNTKLGINGNVELGKIETKGRGFLLGDVITIEAVGYTKSKTITIHQLKEEKSEQKEKTE